MKKILILFLILASIKLYGQYSKFDKELHIGDYVPDLLLNDIGNNHTGKERISDFKGKLLVLDFWGTTCSTCIAAWPNLKLMQDEFGTKIQILLVNSEAADTKEKLDAFYKRREARKLYNPQLPYINQAFKLGELFPHYIIPHLVWIDKTGKVIAISDHNYLTAKNINLALNNELKLPLKRSHPLSFNANLPLLVNNNAGTADDFLFRSVITKYIDGIPGITKTDVFDGKNGKMFKLLITQSKVSDLYKKAYSLDFPEPEGFSNNKRLDIHLKDLNMYTTEKDPDKLTGFVSKYVYCYEVIVPEASKKNIYNIMKNDLDNYFNINSSIEEKELKCLVIQRTSELDKFSAKEPSAPSESNIDDPLAKNRYYFKNFPGGVARFIYKLNKSKALPIILDETGIGSRHVDLDLNADLYDIPALRRELKRYDLTIVEASRKMKVLVLKDRQ